MSTFDHFIITRFNLRREGDVWTTDKHQQVTLTEEWMRHRMKIFEEYCLPSLIHQSNQCFTWLLYFDSSTDAAFIPAIREWEAKYSIIKVKFVDGYSGFSVSHPEDILALRNPENQYVITTRIDNDDAIHKDLIEKIQQSFNFQDFTAVNFPKIYCLQPTSPPEMTLRIVFSSHFISLIERVQDQQIKGCYSRLDHEWDQPGQIIQIKDKVYCLEIIHERNILNSLRGFPIFLKGLADFQIEKSLSFKFRWTYLRFWEMPWKPWLKLYLK